MKGTIYVIKNLVNNKLYVGQTICNPKYRYSKHLHDAFKANSQTAIHTAMRKYGKNNFEMRVIENCDIEVINEREQHWIKELDTYNSGYNRTLSSGTDPKDFSTMIEEFKQGKTITELANQYHTCRKSLAYMLKLEGIDTRLNQTRPPLTKEKYEQAKALYLQGYTMRKIEQELHTCRKHLAKLFEQEGLIVLKGGNAKTHHPYKNSTAS